MAYVDTNALKTYLGIPSATTADDTFLGLLIVRAQQAIDSFCERTFEASDTIRLFDAECNVKGRTLYFDTDLAATPTTVLNGDGSTITSSQYVMEPRNVAPYYALTLKLTTTQMWFWTTTPENAISVTGKWAYSATAPADIQHVCIRLAAFMYRQKEGNNDADRPLSTPGGVVLLPSSLPHDMKELLYPYRRSSL